MRSLSEKRFSDSLSIDANFSRTLYSYSNKNSTNSCNIQKQFPIENFSVKSGFYGAFLKDSIYSAYGKKLISQYS